MQRITEELIRKRSEHNDREIGSLEEISLHQEDIGKLEHIQHWCKDLKILLLHNNLISKIENLGKLKKLEYINFSLNNITKIENLEGCESLEKLDFTLNFIGDLLSVEKLKSNIHLHTLYMNGNPCTDYEGYRDYVIATLPNLKYLDGQEILRSERIQAMQRLGEITPEIIRQQNQYLVNWYKTRTDEDFRSDYEDEDEEDDVDGNKERNEEENKNFWSQKHGNCPEVRIVLAKERRRREKEKQEKKPPKKKPRRLFNDNGEPLNVNQPKIQFTLDDDYWNSLYTLDVAVYKHLDIALINADVNPFYVRVVIKGKILQLRLDEEVCPDKSMAKRSQTTGHLVITMPKVKEVIRPYKTVAQLKKENVVKSKKKEKINREFLEVQGEFDLKKALTISNEEKTTFIDNPEVPPLE